MAAPGRKRADMDITIHPEEDRMAGLIHHLKRVRGVWVVMLAAMAVCSGPAAAAERQKLEVGIAVANPNTASLIWAKETGIFDRLGLDVTIRVSRTMTSTEASTGRLVLGMAGSTVIFPAISEGRAMKIVTALASGNASAFVTVLANAPYKSLEDLSGGTVSVIGSTGPGYGGAKAYSDYIVSKGGKPLKILSYREPSAAAAALVAGNIQATVGSPVYGEQIAAGRFRMLLDANAPEARRLTGEVVPNVVFFGLDETLAKNREAVTRFVAGLRVARRALAKVSDEKVAEVMGKDENFAPSVIKPALLAEQVRLGRPFFATEEGFISPATWKTGLATFANWDIQVASGIADLADPRFGYERAIDMSYWNAATKLIESTKFTPAMLGG
jgi:ABC-type nitrate/sulfonate/bicarbonate transport system substrate-binding protein